MLKKIILMLSLTVATATSVSYYFWTQTPEYSLQQLQKAIANHDRAETEKFLDIESVALEVLDYAITEAESKPAQNKWENAGRALARGFFEMAKPQLARAARETFLKYVETGSFTDTANNNLAATGVDTAIKSVKEGNLTLIEVGPTKKQGKIAYVTLRLKNKAGEVLTPDIKMRQADGYWQVFGVDDVGTLIKRTSGVENEK